MQRTPTKTGRTKPRSPPRGDRSLAGAGKRAGGSGDSLVYVAPSLIHGKGLFAARAITRGRFIGVYEGTPSARDGRYVLWVQTEEGGFRGVRGRGVLRYLNHSDTPNAVFRGDRLYARRAIAADEEITIDYDPPMR